MKTVINHCDLCHKAVGGPGISHNISGACVEIGQSVGVGGWGARTTPVHFSGEICDECFAEFKIFAGAFKRWLNARGGIRAPKITITERDVSAVWEDQPSPE